jgi:TolA-binding protein
MAVPIVVTLLGHAAQWGTLGADVRNLERRATTAETELARVSAAQASASAQAARVEAQLEAMRGELARLARAIERLADGPHASR